MLKGDIPDLRILIVGGEACPQHIVQTWSKHGRRIFNTYGPTEATVIATYAELFADKKVNIGKPLPNYSIFIMKDDGSFARKNEEGELLIAGIGLARGYVGCGNLTEEKFIWKVLPGGNKPVRVYRSGDLAKFNRNGEIEFLGRMDSQIKLRGYRVELSEIESVLNSIEGIKASVVSVFKSEEGVQTLASYIVADGDRANVNFDKVRRTLALKLPSYMIPQYMDFIDRIPVIPSGKADRRALPKPVMKLSSGKSIIVPRTDIEEKIATVWGKIFEIDNQNLDKISVKDHFFNDLGGHSLLAAEAVSVLREDPKMSSMDFSDIYEYPTIEALAGKIESEKHLRKTDENENKIKKESNFLSSSAIKHRLCGIIQLVIFYKMHFLLSLPMAGFLYIVYSIYSNTFDLGSVSNRIIILLTVVLGSLPALLFMSIAAKWLLIGRFKPGKYPLWGQYYIRWWIVRALHNLFPVFILCGTPFMSIYLRLMGAKVGRNCYIATHHTFCYDVLQIGEETSIGLESQLLGYAVEDGYLKIGNIKVGNRCYVGAGSILCTNTVMEDGSMLLEQSMLTQGSTIPRLESWLGSPAKNDTILDGDIVELKAKNTGNNVSRGKKLVYGIGQMVAFSILGLAAFFVFAPVAVLVLALIYFTFITNKEWLLLLSPALAVFTVIFGCLEMALIKRIFVGKVKQGVYDIYSFFHFKKWIVDQMMHASLSVFHTLYATLYTPIFLRMMGAKLGKNVEISTVSHISPDLLDIGDRCFFADASMAGTPKVYMGSVKIAGIKTGSKTFIGNSALLPINSNIGSNCLLGVMSIPPRGGKTRSKTSWLGTPAIFLPKRLVNNDFSETETYTPKRNMIFKRLGIEFFRVILPMAVNAFSFMAVLFILAYLNMFTSFWGLAFSLPALWIASEVFGLFAVLAFKWILIGKYTPRIKPLWSTFVWRTEFVTGIYEAKNVPMFLDFLRGTPFLPMALRLFGCKIGKRVFLDSTFFSEFDLVDIGDETAVNHNSTMQTHLFEDRVMKMSRLKIEKRCMVGNASVVLYDTVMKEGAKLGSLSLLMKGEVLPRWTSWEGNPARRSN
jgi:non-ribosomal peptide synthetase-like protein